VTDVEVAGRPSCFRGGREGCREEEDDKRGRLSVRGGGNAGARASAADAGLGRLLGRVAGRERERGSASGPTSWAEPDGERGEIGPVRILFLFFFK
jgi:hypothetical protein